MAVTATPRKAPARAASTKAAKPSPAPAAKPAKDSFAEPKATYMTKEEFTRIGERLFGKGWQTRLSQLVSRDRSQINRYVGGDPIPPYMALLMHYFEQDLDEGRPLRPIAPVGVVTENGFRPAPPAINRRR